MKEIWRKISGLIFEIGKIKKVLLLLGAVFFILMLFDAILIFFLIDKIAGVCFFIFFVFVFILILKEVK